MLPLILDNAEVKISDDGTELGLTSLACWTNHLELNPDVSTVTVTTFCGEKDYPGAVKWTLTLTLHQDVVDPAGTEAVLSAIVEAGVATPFQVYGYRDQPIGPANPAWEGMVIPQPYAPINGDAGDASTIELEWALDGPPTKVTSPTALAASSSSGSGSV